MCGGFLNDRAPLESRLFIDLDVNKLHKDSPPPMEISDSDVISFGKTLNRIIDRVRHKEPDVGRVLNFPDFSSQIYVD